MARLEKLGVKPRSKCKVANWLLIEFWYVKFWVMFQFFLSLSSPNQDGATLSSSEMFFNGQEGTKSGHKQLLNHKLLVPYGFLKNEKKLN